MTVTDTSSRSLSYGQAFNEAVTQLMRDDDSVFVAGEDVAGYGGVFRTFAGLLGEFGARRVVDTPISEQAIVGLGTGAAVTGLRPIVDLMFMDFMGVAMDQIVNQAAKLKFMFGGTATVPLTITTWAGAGLGAAAQHSQSLEAWLCHVPGLKVVFPSTPYDMKGLMVAAVREPNPVVMIGGKRMLGDKGPVPEDLYEIPLGEGDVKRDGSDVTVVAIGRMVGQALKAAEVLAGEGIECTVIDPRTLQPFDSQLVIDSVRATHHAVVAHEAVRFCGIGAEIAAEIQELAFDDLDAPVARVGAPFAPVPFSPELERSYVPDAATVAEAVRRTVGRGGDGA